MTLWGTHLDALLETLWGILWDALWALLLEMQWALLREQHLENLMAQMLVDVWAILLVMVWAGLWACQWDCLMVLVWVLHLVFLNASLLEMLWEHAVQTEFTVRFKWEPGSVAFWDNRATAHLAPTDIFATDFDRQFYRVTLAGEPLVGVAGKRSVAVSGKPIPAL